MSTFNFNGMKPYAMAAGTTYTINLELWGLNQNVSRDFSLVALSDGGQQVVFTHMQGLVST
jgi:hypothetical protein